VIVSAPVPLEVGGYILAGGKSSRMGREKALVELAGKPLIGHAVEKVRRVCMDVRILSNNEELAVFTPIVRDIHPGCGPMSGMEAGLRHSMFEWNLFMAVDMPFVPSAFLFDWLARKLSARRDSALGRVRVQIFEHGGMPQPGLCLLHKDVAPFLTQALEQGEYKLVPALKRAGHALAERDGLLPGSGFFCLPLVQYGEAERGFGEGQDWRSVSDPQRTAMPLWFSNLNTPEDLAEAERHVDALDT
jgi:molybdopterin-guanine dinucleotide biosynthesis protein A